ncbi:LppU/SCO3897 family protein [Micromonospora sp. NPDC003197]
MVLLCVCGGVGIWAFTSDDDDEKDPIAQPTATSTARPTSEPSTDPTPSASSTDDDDDDTSYRKGDCLKNEGTNSSPKLRKVPCGPGTYEVLSRIPFTTDVEKCKTDPIFGAKEADANYYYDSSMNSADYVLCLKKR